MPILIDISELTDSQTDTAFDEMYKAINGHEDDDGIWMPHHSPFLTRMIELFTQRGLMRLDGFRKEYQQWANGEKFRPGHRPARPDGAMERWTDGELALVKLYLETLPAAEYTLDDHMMVVDYLAQRYLPADELRTEAEWLAVRSSLMGRVQSNMEKLTAQQADSLLAAMPNTVDQAAHQFKMDKEQEAVMAFGRARCVENVTGLADSVRRRMRGLVLKHQEAIFLHDKTAEPGSLQSQLLDTFGQMNRDWRRIALTEAAENQNQGYVASLKPGTKLRRHEMYKDACPFCQKINGVVMEVVAPDKLYKDGAKEIWTGKTNIGRSASPRKRQGGILIERDPDDMWWIPAGVVHPHCRGSWLPVIEDRPGDDPEFGDWLRATLGKKS